MAKIAGNPDLVQQFRQTQEKVRRLETRTSQTWSDTKTFVVSGVITPGFQVPPYFISMSPIYDPTAPRQETGPQETRYLIGVVAKLLDGTCTVHLTRNDDTIIGPENPYPVSATSPDRWTGINLALEDRDRLGFDVVSASDVARDLSVSFIMRITIWP
jgi:hypothetical protein